MANALLILKVVNSLLCGDNLAVVVGGLNNYNCGVSLNKEGYGKLYFL